MKEASYLLGCIVLPACYLSHPVGGERSDAGIVDAAADTPTFDVPSFDVPSLDVPFVDTAVECSIELRGEGLLIGMTVTDPDACDSIEVCATNENVERVRSIGAECERTDACDFRCSLARSRGDRVESVCRLLEITDDVSCWLFGP